MYIISPTTRSRSQSSAPLLASRIGFLRKISGRAGNQNEAAIPQSCFPFGNCPIAACDHARVLETRWRRRQRWQRRLLDMHNASFGTREGTRKMSYLFDGPCAGDEGERNPSALH